MQLIVAQLDNKSSTFNAVPSVGAADLRPQGRSAVYTSTRHPDLCSLRGNLKLRRRQQKCVCSVVRSLRMCDRLECKQYKRCLCVPGCRKGQFTGASSACVCAVWLSSAFVRWTSGGCLVNMEASGNEALPLARCLRSQVLTTVAFGLRLIVT
jgi:hypothetical protein